MLYPSTYEGFGLIPFEAAVAGTPCLFAHVSALRDTLPADAATLVPWDAARSAQRVIDVLRDPARARRGRRAVREAARRPDVGCHGAGRARRIRRRRRFAGPRDGAGRSARRPGRARLLGLRADLGPLGIALVGEDDRFLDDESQRGLARIASRERLRAPLRAALKAVAKLPSGSETASRVRAAATAH